jgi:hypothetical protein
VNEVAGKPQGIGIEQPRKETWERRIDSTQRREGSAESIRRGISHNCRNVERGFDEFVEMTHVNSGGSHNGVGTAFQGKTRGYPETKGGSGLQSDRRLGAAAGTMLG